MKQIDMTAFTYVPLVSVWSNIYVESEGHDSKK